VVCSWVGFLLALVAMPSLGEGGNSVCLADEAKTLMHSASSDIAQATADQIYGLEEPDGSEGSGWNAPDIAGCVGDLGLGIDVSLPGLGEGGDGSGGGGNGGTSSGANNGVGSACQLVNDTISSGLDRWGEFTANNDYLGQLGINVNAQLNDATTRLDEYVQRLNEKRNEYR